MNFKKKAVLLGVVAALALVFALPATRAELDWFWTKSQDQAGDYQRYASDWPNSRHAIAARLRYEDRTWSDTKKALIAEALKKNAAAQADPEARKARRQRLERIFWRTVTNENTVFSYQDYLQRYPNGEFADQARRRLDALNRLAQSPGTDTNLPAH